MGIYCKGRGTMKKSLNILVIPMAVLILTFGFLLPIFNTIQEERCILAFSEIVESDLLHVESADETLKDHPDTIAYLMKHPRQTLKLCLSYEAENPESEQLKLVTTIGMDAYERIAHSTGSNDSGSLSAMLKNEHPKLYEELVAQ